VLAAGKTKSRCLAVGRIAANIILLDPFPLGSGAASGEEGFRMLGELYARTADGRSGSSDSGLDRHG
jgi:hypothetical protein